ncbi:MAG: DUF4381 domain-containing protein [Gammaproteobacteria bacterium]|nr:DUF4381 domain-containing protein [Gammaproteobacteria bacterium]MDH4314585.1 DUF4381 domain-containing protein [Gammaproteobacteria bacterium]MDH5214849.1 DUF4381 domain-containing protein [Gammaproteobacteria bacterium]MDH5500061.1 DUF4381 domain-containing protein [Gammaproteobacteria bacterium]
MDPEQIPLRDLHLPEAIGWWPLAPGWWILIGLAIAGVVYLLRRAFLHWRASRPRRIALRELKKVELEYRRGIDTVSLSKKLSQLLRRAMLAYAPRDEVAGLTGQSWLAWLDQGMDGKPFTAGPGQLISTLPYIRPDDRDTETRVEALIDTVRLRLQTPLREAGA